MRKHPYLTQFECEQGLKKAHRRFEKLMKTEDDDEVINAWYDYYEVCRSYHLLPSDNEWKMIWSFRVIRDDLQVKWKSLYNQLEGKFGIPQPQLKDCDKLRAGSWTKDKAFEHFKGFPEGYILQKDDGTVLIRAKEGWIKCSMEEIADVMREQFDVEVPKWEDFQPKVEDVATKEYVDRQVYNPQAETEDFYFGPDTAGKFRQEVDVGYYYCPYIPEEFDKQVKEEAYDRAMKLLLKNPLE